MWIINESVKYCLWKFETFWVWCNRKQEVRWRNEMRNPDRKGLSKDAAAAERNDTNNVSTRWMTNNATGHTGHTPVKVSCCPRSRLSAVGAEVQVWSRMCATADTALVRMRMRKHSNLSGNTTCCRQRRVHLPTYHPGPRRKRVNTIPTLVRREPYTTTAKKSAILK